jgi:hypothetical protein
MPAGKPSGFSFSSMGIDAGIQVGVSLIMASISARANRKSLKDFEFPEIDPTRKIPYAVGTVKLDSPQIIDWYDFKRTAIHFTTGGILSFIAPVIALINLLPFGYRYYLGMTIAMCLGDDVVLEKVYAADKTIFSGTVTGGSSFTIDAHGAFGNEGGMYAVCDFESGSFTQSRNAYYATQRANPPAHRGVAMVYYGGPGRAKGRDAKIKYSGYVSRTNYIRPFAFKVQRCPDLLGDGFENINGEANPAHVIVDLLTSTIYGMGIPTSQIDLDSFTGASETLYNEDYGTSFVWDRDEEVQGVLQRMVDLCDGALFTSPTTGKWTFNLIRRDYDPDDLPILDETNIVEVESYTTRTPDEAVNEVRIDFLEIATDFKKQTATWRSLTNHRIRGEREPVTLHHPVGNKTTANKLASREGLALALPLKHLKIKVNREAFNFTPGSAFRFSWPDYGIVQEIYRVSRIQLGSLTQNTISLDCVLDRFGFGAEMYGETVDFNWVTPVEADSDFDDEDPQVVNSVALAPPVSPVNGDAYIVDVSATGDFSGHDGEIATYFDGTWTFTSQDDDTRVYNEADGKFYDVSGGTWTDALVGLITGDVSGYLPDLTVVGLQTRDVAADAPADGDLLTWNDGLSQWEPQPPSGGAPASASYITKVAEAGLSNEFALGSLATGILKNTTTTGVPTIADVNDISAPVFAADAGSNDTYVATLSPVPSAYVTGTQYRFKANTANTGACTVNFNSLGAKTIKKPVGGVTSDLDDNDIRANQWVDVVYDGTNMQMQSNLGNPVGGALGASIAPLVIEDANTVAQRNGANAQRLNVYNGYTDASNNSGVAIHFDGSFSYVKNFVNGTGTARTLQILATGALLLGANTAGSQKSISISTAGDWVPTGNGTQSLGTSGSRFLNLWTGGLAGQSQSPAQITANQGNYNSGSNNYLQRLSTDASRTINGWNPGNASPLEGQLMLIVNVGSNDLVLAHDSASSTNTDRRFLCSTGADITLTANQAADVLYDKTTLRWRVFKRN